MSAAIKTKEISHDLNSKDLPYSVTVFCRVTRMLHLALKLSILTSNENSKLSTFLLSTILTKCVTLPSAFIILVVNKHFISFEYVDSPSLSYIVSATIKAIQFTCIQKSVALLCHHLLHSGITSTEIINLDFKQTIE